MRIVVADTGKSFTVETDANVLVERFKESLVASTGIAKNYQILITDHGDKLESRTQLSKLSYKLFTPSPPTVYLFDRNSLTSTRSRDLLSPAAFVVQSLPTPADPQNHPLAQSSSILMQSLPRYQFNFVKHRNLAQSFVKLSNDRSKGCADLILRLQNQQGAMRAVTNHLRKHFQNLGQKMDLFNFKFSTQAREHEELLLNFESNIASLSRVQLHPALQSENRRNLLSAVPVNELRRWYSDCMSEHESLVSKVKLLKETVTQINEALNTEMSAKQRKEFLHLEAEVQKMKDVHISEKQLLTIFEKDLRDVSIVIKKAVDNLSVPNHSSMMIEKSLTDQMQEFDREHNKQVNDLLPRLQNYENESQRLLDIFVQEQTTSQISFHNHVRQVSKLQTQMRDLTNKLALFEEAMSRKTKKFDQFVKVEKLPAAYEESLVEVVRRAAYNNQLKEGAREVILLFNEMQEEEVERRREFVNEHGKNIPAGLFPGLNSIPSHVKIEIENNDEQLPDIQSVITENHGRVTMELYRRPFLSKNKSSQISIDELKRELESTTQQLEKVTEQKNLLMAQVEEMTLGSERSHSFSPPTRLASSNPLGRLASSRIGDDFDSWEQKVLAQQEQLQRSQQLLIDEVTSLRKEKTDLQDQVNLKNQQSVEGVMALATRNSELEKENYKLKERILYFDREREKFQETLSKSESERARLENHIKELTRLKKAEVRRREDLEAEFQTKLFLKDEEHSRKIQELEQHVASYQEITQSFSPTKEASQMRNELDTTKEKLMESEIQFKKSLADVTKENKILISQRDKLLEEFEEQCSKSSSLREQIGALDSQKTDLERESEELRMSLDGMRSQNISLQDQNQQHKARIKVLEKQKEGVMSDLKDAEESYATLREKTDNEIASLYSERNNLTEILQDVKSNFVTMQSLDDGDTCVFELVGDSDRFHYRLVHLGELKLPHILSMEGAGRRASVLLSTRPSSIIGKIIFRETRETRKNDRFQLDVGSQVTIIHAQILYPSVDLENGSGAV